MKIRFITLITCQSPNETLDFKTGSFIAVFEKSSLKVIHQHRSELCNATDE